MIDDDDREERGKAIRDLADAVAEYNEASSQVSAAAEIAREAGCTDEEMTGVGWFEDA